MKSLHAKMSPNMKIIYHLNENIMKNKNVSLPGERSLTQSMKNREKIHQILNINVTFYFIYLFYR